MNAPGDPVTAEEITAAVLVKFSDTIEQGFDENYVHNVFGVYLYTEDYKHLSPFFERIKKSTIRALDAEFKALNRPKGRGIFQKRVPAKRHEKNGDWVVDFFLDHDEDAAERRLDVRSSGTPPSPDSRIIGPATEQIIIKPTATEGIHPPMPHRVEPVSAAPDPQVYAVLTYSDLGGNPKAFDMTRKLIKCGRGGPDEYVDLVLATGVDVAREHFQLRHDSESGSFWIKDLSKFGTFVNGLRVPSSIRVVNGEEYDDNFEQELGPEVTINLAEVFPIQFQARVTKRWQAS